MRENRFKWFENGSRRPIDTPFKCNYEPEAQIKRVEQDLGSFRKRL